MEVMAMMEKMAKTEPKRKSKILLKECEMEVEEVYDEDNKLVDFPIKTCIFAIILYIKFNRLITLQFPYCLTSHNQFIYTKKY
ncbi:hypothetical protein pb186bvf_001718 [Paramecium bursaria]